VTGPLRLIIHPGLGKTATSTLQGVLRSQEHVWFGGVRSHPIDHPFSVAFERVMREPLERITWRRSVPLEPSISALAAAVAEGLASSPSGAGVLSQEAILGHVGDDLGWRGPYEAALRRRTPGWRIAVERLRRLEMMIEHLRSLLGPDLRITGLLTIRRQGDLLGSTWAWNYEHYRSFGVESEDDLLALVSAGRFPRMRFGAVADAMEASGMESVEVLPMELLTQDPESFWGRLSALVGTPLGPVSHDQPVVANRRRLPRGTWRIRSVANRPIAFVGTSAAFDYAVRNASPLLRGRLEHALRPRSADGPLLAVSSRFLEAVDDIHAPENDRLSGSRGVDLASLGYSTSLQIDASPDT
jgi:hypothetical protein